MWAAYFRDEMQKREIEARPKRPDCTPEELAREIKRVRSEMYMDAWLKKVLRNTRGKFVRTFY